MVDVLRDVREFDGLTTNDLLSAMALATEVAECLLAEGALPEPPHEVKVVLDLAKAVGYRTQSSGCTACPSFGGSE